MPPLRVETIERLTASDLEQRRQAFERFVAAPAPSTEQELWRYSRISELKIDEFELGALHTTVDAPAGVVVTDVVSAEELELDGFGELNRAFATTITVTVPAGRVIETPVVINHHLTNPGTCCLPRLVIDAGENSELTVIERFTSDDVIGLIIPVVHARAAQAARLRYLAINELGPQVWQIANQSSTGERDSSTLLAAVALGGDYARVRTHARLVGQGASTRQVALYFADGTQSHDFRPTQEHVAPKTTSDMLFKGAVSGSARSVYTGLIKIGADARGAQAFQTNRNLTLSDDSWADSVPNLEIDTNDVKCSHASTIGPIDEEQRFYLESRGIPPEIAERLVVLGFFDEVLAQLPIGDLRYELREIVAAKLTKQAVAV